MEYEKEIRRVATFGSIESFLHLYSHLTPPNELPAVTDVLVFLSRIGRPGVWEEMREGGKFTLRLQHPITPFLYESLLMALVGDQFDESDAVVGLVLSVRQPEDILSLWVEEEGDGVKSGALREKIIRLLSLPPSTTCEYRPFRALLDVAGQPKAQAGGSAALDGSAVDHGAVPLAGHEGGRHEGGERRYINRERGDRGDRAERGDRGERQERGDRPERADGERAPRGAWGRDRQDGGGYRLPRDDATSRTGWEARNGWSSRRAEQ